MLHDFLLPARLRAAMAQGLAHFASSGEGPVIGKTSEMVALRRDGTELPVELSLSALRLEEGGWHATGIARNISERRLHEAQIKRLNRTLRTLSTCNMTLVRAQSEQELFRHVCRHIVEIGEYRLAFVAISHDDAAKSIEIAAQHGAKKGQLESLGLDRADTGERQSLLGSVISSGVQQLVQNIKSDFTLGDWREVAAKLGINSSIMLPLKLEYGLPFGALTIAAAEADAFDEAAVALLSELAIDMAYGVTTLRTRIERDQAVSGEQAQAALLRQALEQTIVAIALTVEKRDPYTAGHQQRVAQLAVAIATDMGLTAQQIEGIRFGAQIHDIGKIYLPAEILTRPGKLLDLEFQFIKTHAQVGYEIVKDVPFPWPVAQMVRQHHERLDGSGYPLGLKGDEIILEARILAVADVLEAMSAHRPYRPAKGIEVAIKELEAGSGSLFDAQAVAACVRLFRDQGFAFQT